jgi:hypothetical protein
MEQRPQRPLGPQIASLPPAGHPSRPDPKLQLLGAVPRAQCCQASQLGCWRKELVSRSQCLWLKAHPFPTSQPRPGVRVPDAVTEAWGVLHNGRSSCGTNCRRRRKAQTAPGKMAGSGDSGGLMSVCVSVCVCLCTCQGIG